MEQSNTELLHQSESIRHQLTHQLLLTKFYHFEVNKEQCKQLKKKYQSVSTTALKNHALPQLLVKYVNEMQW